MWAVGFCANSCWFNTVSYGNSASICACLLNTARRYDLIHFIVNYVKHGHFPSKSAWRNLVVKTISVSEEQKWKAALSVREDMSRYSKVHVNLKMHSLYDLIYEYPDYRKELQTVINVISRGKTSKECTKCHTQCFDHDCHIILYCENYMHDRNTFYNKLIDQLPLEEYIQIEMLDDDDDIISFFCGANLISVIDNNTRKIIVLHFAMYIYKLKQSFMYSFWFSLCVNVILCLCI